MRGRGCVTGCVTDSAGYRGSSSAHVARALVPLDNTRPAFEHPEGLVPNPGPEGPA